MFKLLADYRTNKIYLSEILQTAQTLGIHEKYKIVYRCLERFQEDIGDEPIDFETFVKELTQRIVIFKHFFYIIISFHWMFASYI